jgi:hypothetical protein
MSTPILVILILAGEICFGLSLLFVLGSRDTPDPSSSAPNTNRPAIARLMICMGCLTLVGAIALLLHTWHFTRNAQRTAGVVTELRAAGKDASETIYAPTFQFHDASRTAHKVSSSFYSSPPEFQVGDKVQILYHRDAPQSARIDSYWQVWGFPSLLGIIGSVGLPIGIAALFWPKIIARMRR